MFRRSGFLSTLGARVAFAVVAFSTVSANSFAQTDTTWITNGDGLWTDAANWDSGEPGGGGNPNFNAFIDDGDSAVTVTLNAPRAIQDLTIGADDALDIASGGLTLSGGSLNNDGTLTVNSNGANTDVSLFANGADLAISGAGEIVLNNLTGPTTPQRASIDSGFGFTITQGADHTIRGQGRITATLVNNGTVRADGPNGLQLVSNNMTNNNVFEAVGADLIISGIDITNTSGTITADNGNVFIRSSARIIGGTLNTTNGGKFVANTGPAILQGVTNNGDFDILNGQNVQLENGLTNNGTITLGLGNINADSQINAINSLTIDGTGEIILDNTTSVLTPQRASIDAAMGETITQGADHTISGQGRITAALLNNGTVRADRINGLQLVGSDKTNNNVFEAVGADLIISGIDITNTSGTITADNGNVFIRSSARIIGGTLNTTNGGKFVANTGPAILQGVTNNGDFDILNGQNVQLENGLTNNGTITLGLGNINADSQINAINSLTIDGTGEIILDNTFGSSAPQRASLDAAVGETITQGADHTISGQGRITAALVNNGTVRADRINGLQLVGSDKTNNNVFEAVGADLIISGIDITNTSGTITADNGNVFIRSSARIIGGTLNTTNGGKFVSDFGSAVLQDVTNHGDFDILNGHNVQLENGLTNNGVITLGLGDVNTNSAINAVNSLTIDGTGEIILDNTFGPSAPQRASVDAAVGETITQGADHTISGQGRITAALVNNGTVRADRINGLQLVGSDKTNNNVFEAVGADLIISGIDITNTSGTITADNGNVFIRSSARIIGGTLNTTNGGKFVSDFGSAVLQDVTNHGDFDILNGHNVQLENGLTNNGVITLGLGDVNTNSAINAVNSLTIDGTGEIILDNTFGPSAPQRASVDAAVGQTITQGADHTISGKGRITATLVNDGTVSAEGGLLQLRDGDKTNNGVFQALDGATLDQLTGTLTNLAAGTLTGGTYRSVDTGSGATVSLLGTPVTTIAFGTDVTLSGAGAAMTFGGVDVEASLTSNNGVLQILDGHTFNMTSALNNNGLLVMGGTGASAVVTSGGDITNTSSGTIVGHGAINNNVLNSGFVIADAGTLSIVGGVIGSQATSSGIISNAGGTMDLSATTGNSDTNLLSNNGNLDLGVNDVLVRGDYRNQNFGVGNAFNHRANVSGSGQILADPAVSQTLSGDVTDGAAATATLSFGNTRVGVAINRSYSIDNVGGSGPMLRGAIQTDNSAGNGGNLTSSALTGAGVAAGNFGPIAAGGSAGPLAVTFDPTIAGALFNQQVAIVNNFDNVANQVLQFTGAAYNPAVANVTPAGINLGNFHVGDAVAGQVVTIANTAPAGAFSEDLLANNFAAIGDATVSAAPTSVQVLAGDNTAGPTVGVSTASAGNKSGAFTADLFSNGTVNGATIAGLGQLGLGSANIPVSGTVYRLASPNLPVDPTDLGDFHVGDTIAGSFVVENTAAADGFSESVEVNVTGFIDDAVLAGGSASIAPGGNSGGALTVQLASSAGAKSGTVQYSQTSLAAAAGLTNTNLGVGNAEITARVYELAVAQVGNSQPIDFGIVHVGDPAPTVNLSINNNAQLGGFGENLNASFDSTPVGVTGTGAVSGLAPQANDSTSMALTLDTSTAGIVSGNAVVDFVSDGTGINTLGQTSLGSQNVAIMGQVNEFANPDFFKDSGQGSFTQNSATTYTLDFGTVLQNTLVGADLGLFNDVILPADTLAGMFTTGGDAAFSFTNFTAFSGITAGDSLDDLLVDFDTSSLGTFSGSVTLMPRSQNASGFDGALANLTINITGSVSAIPEPSTYLAALLGGVALVTIARAKRSFQR